MGLLYRPVDRGRAPRPPVQKSSLVGMGTAGAKGIGAVQKSLDTLDKVHETRLENSKLLADKKWSIDIGGKKTDIFQRTDMDASINPMKYYKRTTTPTFQRIKVSQDVLDEKGFGHIKDMLKGQDYTDSQILDIARNSGVKIHEYDPNMMAYDSRYDPDIWTSSQAPLPQGKTGMVGRDELMELEPSGISKALDNLQDIAGDKIGDVGEWAAGHAGDFAGDIGAVGAAIGGGLKEFGGDILDIGGNVLDKTGAVGDYGQHVLGTAMNKGGRLLGDVAGSVAGKVGAAGDYGAHVLGTALGKGGKLLGNIAGVGSKALPIAGAAMGAKKAIGGIGDLFKEGSRLQGAEDVVQGAIGMASPLLLAAGPAGWAVLGASFLEDMLFD